MRETVEKSPNNNESDFHKNPRGQNMDRLKAVFYMPGVINGTIEIGAPEGTYERDFDKRTPATFTPKETDPDR